MIKQNKYDVWQIDLTVNGVRCRDSTKTKNYKLAMKIHALKEAEMLKEAHGMSKKVYSLDEAFTHALEVHWRGSKNIKKVQQNWELLKVHIDTSKDVSSITPDEIRRITSELFKLGNSNATVNRKMATLRTLLNLCVDWGKLSHCPKIKALKEPPSRHRVLTDAEEVSMIRFFDKTYPEHSGLFIFLLSSANRLSEVLKLTWFDVDFSGGVVKFRDTKSGDTIHKPMTKAMRSILENRKQLTQPFPYTVDTIEHIWKAFRKHMDYQGDKTFVIHCLRHTCASRLVIGGMDLKRVQQWLGHKSYTTTLKYAQLLPSHLGDVVNSLDDFDHSLSTASQSRTSSDLVVNLKGS